MHILTKTLCLNLSKWVIELDVVFLLTLWYLCKQFGFAADTGRLLKFRTNLVIGWLRTKAITQHFSNKSFKDARSVSLYHYNRSHVLQYIKYTKLINIKRNQSFVTNNVLFKKIQQQQNKSKAWRYWRVGHKKPFDKEAV